MRSNRNYAFALLALVAALAGCGGASTGGVITPTAAPSATPTPVPPAWTTNVPFTVKRIANMAASNTLPNGGGFSGTLSTQALLLKYTQATMQLTNVDPAVAPPVSGTSATLAYIGLETTLAVPSAPLTISVQLPQAAVQSNAAYYLALYDPQRPSLGWQRAFAGPATVNTASGAPTLTFTGNAPLLNRYEQYWFAVYMQPSSAATPSAAPSMAPSVTPSPAPTSFTEIQRTMSMADTCSGTPCATGPIPSPQPTQNYLLVTDLPFPTHSSGFTTKLTLFPMTNQDGDVLYYTPSLGEYPLATNFIWDFWVMIDQDVWDPLGAKPLAMAALEFDFNAASPGEPGFDYNFSSQCLLRDGSNGGPIWEIWGQKGSGTGWIPSGITCYPTIEFSPWVWHHIQWQYRLHPDTLQTEYVQLTIDGAPQPAPNPAINPVQEVKKQAKPTIEVQFQQDARGLASPPPSFNEWIDDVTLTYW